LEYARVSLQSSLMVLIISSELKSHNFFKTGLDCGCDSKKPRIRILKSSSSK
jgi:hypothetical protein